MEEASYKPTSSTQENEYELAPFVKGEIEPQPHIVSDGKSSRQSVWSIPVIILTVLMCIILLLLVTIIIMTGLILTARDATSTGSNINSYYNSSLQSLNNNSQQQCPNLTELANGVVQKLNDNNQQHYQCPNFTQWANNVVQILNDNSQHQFPNFTQWSDDIVTGVYQSLDPSLSSLSDGVSLNNNTLVLSLITQLNNTMQDTANKVDVIGKFNEEEETFHENNTLLLDRVMEIVSSSVIKLNNVIGTLSNIKDTSTSTAGVVDDILLIAQELLVLHNVSTALPTSCKEIKQEQPNSPSGVYLLVTASGTSSYYTYCNMGTLCGSGGGWTRLAYLDMSDATESCPSGFGLYQSGGVRACGRATSSGGSCVSVQFPSNGISYSQVCGRVVGYQYNSPDAVYPSHGSSGSHNDINSYYVDGVSITRGSPRQHVWTLMTGNLEQNSDSQYNCPCATGSTQQVQSFIGDHNYCESGVAGASYSQQLYTSDPLWDGQSCGSAESSCCNVPGIPWFHRDYGSTTTTDYIELRVCGDEGTANEDVPVSYYEIYVQ